MGKRLRHHSTMPGKFTLVCEDHRSRQFHRAALTAFPGSLLHTAHECLDPEETELKLEVPWMTEQLLNALVDALETKHLLIPQGVDNMTIRQLVAYARLPVEALPFGLRRNAASERLVDDGVAKIVKPFLEHLEKQPPDTWNVLLNMNIGWLHKVKKPQELISRVQTALAAQGITATITADGPSDGHSMRLDRLVISANW